MPCANQQAFKASVFILNLFQPFEIRLHHHAAKDIEISVCRPAQELSRSRRVAQQQIDLRRPKESWRNPYQQSSRLGVSANLRFALPLPNELAINR